MAVRTRTVLPANRWVHVAVTHDASGKAAGLHICLDGKLAETEVVRDNLCKNTESGGGATYNGGQSGFAFGARFRSTGLKDGLLDELRIYNRELTAVEIAHLHDGKALAEALERKDEPALRSYYFSAVDTEALKAREELLRDLVVHS